MKPNTDALPWALRFSSNDFPERYRSEMFRDLLGRAVLGMEIEAFSERAFLLESKAVQLPAALVSEHVVASAKTSRTASLLADGNDDVHLMFVTAGRAAFKTRYGESTLTPGDALVSAASEVTSQATPAEARAGMVSLKRRLLAPLVGRLDDKCLRPVTGGDGAVTLLKSYMGMIADLAAAPPVAARHLISGHLYDLAALALGGTRDAVEAARAGGLRAARLAAVKADIHGHLGEPSISTAWLARRQGVSESYVRRLFESEGVSVSAFVLEARLRKAHELLADLRLRDRPVSLVAYSVGFGDLSYFNRTFRRRFDATPSDVRARSKEIAVEQTGP